MSDTAIGAAVVIRDGSGRVLLVRHGYGPLNWEVPGGGSQPGESAAETATREAREELGVDIHLGRLTGVYWEPRHGGDAGMYHFVFAANLTAPLPAESGDGKEITDRGWFAPTDLPRPISDFTVRRISDALEASPASLTLIGERQWLE